MKTAGLGFALLLLALLVSPPPSLADGAATGGYWPQFHGPKRDNRSTEKGLLKQWPKGGPRLIWKFAQCGRGYAGVAIVEGTIFTSGDFADKEMVLALDLDGRLLWKTANGRSWKGPHPAARTTPTYDHGVVYQMNPTGRLAAFGAKSGKELWAVDLREKFAAKISRWAFAENVLVDGKVIYCAPGGAKGRVVALDKTTGETLWVNTDIADRAAYCSPILVTHNGSRQLITIMQKSIVSVDARTGKLLWTHPHKTKHDQNVTRPIYRDGYVYASSGHGTGGRLLELNEKGDGVKEVWAGKDLDNCHGGVMLVDRSLYGSGCRLFRRGFLCVDFRTGRTMWSEPRLGKVSVTWADGLLYCLSDRARLSLVEASPERCRVVSQFQVPRESRTLCLAHPVVCGGRLYIRHGNNLFAYDIRAASSP